MKKFLSILTTLIVTGVFFVACNIGLGAAVDTQAPEMNITAPSVGSVIRSDFAIRGTWSDDGVIKADEEEGLVVTLTRTDKTGEPVKVLGSVDHAGNTWTCPINPSTLKLTDGEYQATIDITDTYEHKTTQSITFTVDNTAPIIVLQRPSAKKEDSSPDSYGQTFTLEGQAADDNNVSSIDVFIYSASDVECTNELHKVHLSNVPPTIELDVAKFVENETNDYSKIYGSTTKNGTQNFLCKIVAYDGAQRYPADGTAQSDADKLGNSTDHYYLYEEISADVLNQYKITEVYHMNNGTYTSGDATARAATINTVQETLKAHEIRVGRFSLNPANNPTYLISGRNPLARDGHDFDDVSEWEITNGSKIQVEVSTGLDGVPIDQETLGVYAVECDENGNKVTGKQEIELIPQLRSNHKSTVALITDAAKVTERKNAFSKSGTSHKITVQLDQNKYPNLEFGKTYIFVVKGTDQNNTVVDTFGNVFGFYFATSGAAPKLEVTQPTGLSYLPKDSGITIKGYTHSDVAYPEVTIKVVDKDDATTYTKTYGSVSIAAGEYPEEEIATSTPNNRKRVDFAHEIPKTAFKQNASAQYTVVITASNGEKETTYERTVLYDVEGPTIRIEEVAPEAVKYEAGEAGTKVQNEDGTEKKFLNGQVTVKVSMTDAYDTVNKDAPAAGSNAADHRPYIQILDETGAVVEFKLAGEAAKIKKAFITTPAKQDFTIDTTSIATGTTTKKIKLEVHGWDRAGNEGTKAVAEYEIDQSTDTPVIFPNDSENVTLTYASMQEITDAIANAEAGVTIKSVLTAGSSLTLKLSDDDGIGNYKFEMSEQPDNADESLLKIPEVCDTREGNTYKHIGINPAGGPTDVTFVYSLPTISGKYLCRLTVTDKTAAKKQVTKKFWIMVTGAAPDVSVTTTPVDKILSMNTTAGQTTQNAVKSLSNAIKINSIDGPFTIYRVEKTGATTKETLNITPATGWSSAQAAAGDLVDTFVPSANRCENKVTYLVVDTYGHEGSRELSYDVDSTLPTIDEDSITVPDTDKTSTASFRFVAAANDTAPATGTPAEKASNVSKIQYAFSDGDATAPADTNIMTINGAQALSQTVIFAEDETGSDPTNKGLNAAQEGKKKIWIRAIDAVGNIGNWVSKEFMFDKADPTVSITKYQGETIQETAVGTSAIEIGEKFSLKGTASDSYGLKTIKIWQSISSVTYTPADPDDGTISATKGKLIKTITTPANGEWTIDNLPRKEDDVTQVYLTNGKPTTGTYTYTIEVDDKSEFGTKAAKHAEVTKSVIIDTSAPNDITFSSPDPTTILYGENSLSGSAYVFRGDASDVGSSGMAKIYYAFTASEADEPTDSDWITMSASDGKWTIQRTFVDGTNITDADTQLGEGEHCLWTKPEDKAGNVGNVTHIAFMVDKAAPKLNDYKVAIKKDNDAADADYTVLDGTYKVSGTNNYNVKCLVDANNVAEEHQPAKFQIKGSSIDTNGIKSVEVWQAKTSKTYTTNNATNVDATKGLKLDVTLNADGTWSVNELPRKEDDRTVVAEGPELSGTYVYTIIMEDKSGKGTTEGKKLELTRQVIFDIEKPVSTSCTADNTWLVGNSSINISGLVTDGEGSGLKVVKYKVDNGTYATLPVSSDWTLNYNSSSLTETIPSDASTSHTITVYLEDAAGNISETPYTFKYDKGQPTGTITASKQYVNNSESITLSGTVKDNTSGAYRPVDSAAVVINGQPYSVTPNASGNYSLVVDKDKFGVDGDYVCTITAKDYAGNDLLIENTTTVTKDTVAPHITIDNLDTWLSGKTTIGGTADDEENNKTGSGVDKIFLKVTKGSSEILPETDFATSQTWSKVLDITAYEESTTDSDPYVITAYSVDKAGNKSTEVTNSFKYDKAAPEASLSIDNTYLNAINTVKVSGYAHDGRGTGIGRAVTSATLTIKKEGVTNPIEVIDLLTGNGLPPTSGDPVNYAPGYVTTAGATYGNFSCTISNFRDSLSDGNYTFTLDVEDNAGKKTQQTATLIVDKTLPTIAFADLDTAKTTKAKWIKGITATSIGGTVTETGTGIKEIKINFDGATTWTTVPAATTWTHNIAAATVQNFAENTDAENSVHTVQVYVVDNAGNQSAPTTGYFRYDKADPTMTLTASTEYVNGVTSGDTSKPKVTLSGVATDGTSRPVKSITVTVEGNSTFSRTATYTTTAGNNFGKYTVDIDKDELTDGKQKFIVTTLDYAGNKAEEKVSVTFDKVAPTGTGALNGTSKYSPTVSNIQQTWYNTEQIKVKVSDITEATAGMESVEAKASLVSNPSTESGWSGLTKQSDGSFLGNVTAAGQGANKITFKLTDKAGNTKEYNSTIVYIDTEAPETTGFTMVSIDGDATNTSSKLTNRGTNVKFIVDLKDKADRTPIAKIELDKANKQTTTKGVKLTTGANAGKWEFTIAKEDLPASSGALNFKVYDSVGNVVTYSPISFQVDTKAPTVSFGNVKDADTSTTVTKVNNVDYPVIDINDYLILDVTATDDQGFVRDATDKVTSVYLKYVIDSNVTDPSSYANSLTIDQTTSPWSVQKKLSELTGYADKKYLHLQLTATDKAGNSATATTKTLYINEDSDRPKITLTNLKLTGMAANAPVYLTGTNTLYGLVEDDDGVDTLKYKKGSSTTTWTNITVNNGSFSIPNLAEGNGDYYFQVIEKPLFEGDSATTYESTGTNKLKLYGSDNELKEIGLNVTVDTKNPTLSSVKIQPYSNSTTANGTAEAIGGSCTVGGVTKNIVELIVNATDTNGIKGAAIKLYQKQKDGTEVTKWYRTEDSISKDDIGVTGTITWTGTKAGSSNGENFTWTTDKLTLTGTGTGSLGFKEEDPVTSGTTTTYYDEVEVTTYIIDNSGSVTNNVSSFKIDNTATALSISSPSKDNLVFYGSQSTSFGGAVSGAIDIASIEYAITNSNTAPTTGWITAGTGITTANIAFDGEKDTTDSTKYQTGHNKTLKEFLTTAEQAAYDDCHYYIWFKTTDKCGNTATSNRAITIIPNGDKPSVTVSSPEENAKVAGSLRIFGSVAIAENHVDGVYVQIDPSYDGSTFASDWKTEFQNITHIYDADIVEFQTGKYGIKADGTSIFSIILNRENELNQSTERDCAIRIYAESGSGKLSEPVLIPFKVDPNPPLITDLELVQFDDSGEVAKSMAYSSNMWVSGDWWLRFNAHDDSDLKTLTIGEVNTSTNATVTKKVVTYDTTTKVGTTTGKDSMTNGNGTDTEIRVDAYTSGNRKGQTVTFPLATGSGQGSRKFVIKGIENTDNNFDVETTITLNYDNTAPKLANTKHDDYNMNASVQQSNGFYTLKGYASDTAGSGIERIAFYFVRRSGTPRVFDPMYDNKSANISGLTYSDGLYWKQKTVTRDNNHPEKIELSEKYDFIHVGGLVKLGAGIYRIAELSSDGKTITLKDSPSTSITEACFAIANVVDNSKLEAASGDTKVTNGYRKGYYATINNDDGDGMYESFVEDEATKGVQWSAAINSLNIPDGIIEIHYVAFDKAQNYSIGIVGNVDWNTYKAYTTAEAAAVAGLTPNANTTSGTDTFIYAYDSDNPAFVSNNAPRVVSVIVGCDYNGDGTYSDDEKTIKYANEENHLFGTALKKRSGGGAKKFIASSGGAISGDDGYGIKEIKAGMQVEIELIGGNGDIYLQHSIDGNYTEHESIANFKKYGATTGTNAVDKAPILSGTGRSFDDEGTETDDAGNKYYVGTILAPVSFTEADLKSAVTTNTTLASPTWFTFEIWDSTVELTPFENSQSAFIKLPLAIQVNDTIKPNTVFNDLFWNGGGKEQSSVYYNTSTDKLEGHVELKGTDLGSGFTASNYGTDDDKVSGKIVFRGYAYDNKRLASLTWGITKTKGDKTAANQAWPLTKPETGATYAKSTVSYSNGSWNSSNNLDTNHHTFIVYDNKTDTYLNSDGHKVYWELTIDTSYVQQPGKTDATAWGIGKDLYVYVEATDTSGNTTLLTGNAVTTGTDAQKNIPNMKVDVVPYITGISSRLKDNRSSNGHYQLASGESGVKLLGYNLSQGSNSVDMTVPTESGEYVYTITKGTGQNAVTYQSINNMNKNDALGGVTDNDEKKKAVNKYNYQPVSYNQTLTDDVIIDLWDINTNAATTYRKGLIQEPIAKYNPSTGLLGFAFSNGSNMFSMPGKKYKSTISTGWGGSVNYSWTDENSGNGSYQLWEMNYASYVCNALAYDEDGNSYGISVGIDTEPSSGKAGRMNFFTSLWGMSDGGSQSGNFNNTNNLHIDTIGIPNPSDVTSQTPADDIWANSYQWEKRFSSTSIAVATHGSGNNKTRSVYAAYFDGIRDQIIFRRGATVPNSKGNFNDFTSQGTENTTSFVVEECSVIADAGNITNNTPGSYVDLAVIPGTTAAGDVVLAVWHDGSALQYAYLKNPFYTNNKALVASHKKSDYNAKTEWTTKKLKDNCGEYCKIEVDANGGVHIVAYDATNQSVDYFYLSSYDATYSESANCFIIDASNGPYYELGLDVAVSSVNTANNTTGKAVPTISYYANGTPKMATYSTGFTKSSKPDVSWKDGSFTGKWDVCYVPTNSKLLQDHINAVQPKNPSGVITCVKGDAFASQGGADNGTVSGNNSTNPIMAYAIKENGVAQGHIEIAQRKKPKQNSN